MQKIKLYYCDIPNFGDLLNIELLPRIFPVEIVHASPMKCQMTAIGSVLQSLMKKQWQFAIPLKYFSSVPITVWGSGFIKPPRHRLEGFLRPIEPLALRGKISQARMSEILKKEINVPLGDPGLLAPHLLDRKLPKKYRVGIIPHHHDIHNPLFEKLHAELPDALLISPEATAQQVVEQISQCDLILSSSLHGLIIADSLNIPNAWLTVSDLLLGGVYKFHDYYSIYGLKPSPIDLRLTPLTIYDLNNIESNYTSRLNIIETLTPPLLSAFPFQ